MPKPIAREIEDFYNFREDIIGSRLAKMGIMPSGTIAKLSSNKQIDVGLGELIDRRLAMKEEIWQKRRDELQRIMTMTRLQNLFASLGQMLGTGISELKAKKEQPYDTDFKKWEDLFNQLYNKLNPKQGATIFPHGPETRERYPSVW